MPRPPAAGRPLADRSPTDPPTATRPPAVRLPLPARVLIAAVLCGALLPVATACSSGQPGRTDSATASASATRPAPHAATTMLTAVQAQAALLTEADLGGAWEPTEGAATWRDGVLKAQTDAPECRRLLDALYTDEPLGTPTGTRAVAGFDNTDDQAQLRYQVLSLRQADVDRSLAWLRTLPDTCARFTATTSAGEQAVQVGELALPEVGDARQGLRITFTSASDDGDATTLTLDVAAVRVGDDAITLSDGALGALPSDTTVQAVTLGARRLTDVRHKSRAQA
ncbi:hypothetical protein ACF061_10215 [Streptomyces sp. NPDC015220]|uniref:hypothetical protein n=1 Tax=Streptomyces sp. NPDC015220 TaxID=3364947 RepID=UPI0036FA11C9